MNIKFKAASLAFSSLLLASFGGASAQAASIYYVVNFTGGPDIPTASFTYDTSTDLFSNFFVQQYGFSFDFTLLANVVSAGPGCASNGFGTLLYLNGDCGPAPNWSSITFSNSSFEGGGFSMDFEWGIDDQVFPGVTQRPRSMGSFTIAAVPEPAAGATMALGMSALGLLSIRRRNRHARRT
jgi:hypothetical protein